MNVGDLLPTLRGEFLTGRTAVLPQAAAGRVALLLLGFSYNSRFAVEAWARTFREQFHIAAEPQRVVAILQGRGGRVQGRQAD
jgi:hypothetical protein